MKKFPSPLLRPRNRNRLCSFLAVIAAIAAGLASRHYPSASPAWLGKYPGDALWALMIFLGWGIPFPKASAIHIARLALFTCCLIETLKLYRAPWIVAIRHSTLGHLVFGHAFSWQNIAAYAAGVLAGILLETAAGITKERNAR